MESDYKNSDHTVKKALLGTTAILVYLLYQNHTGFLSWFNLLIISYCIKMLSSYKKRRTLRILWRDIRNLYKLVKISSYIRRMEKQNDTVPKVFRRICEEQPDKIMFRFEDESWTFKQCDEFSNKVARYFASKGVKEGDTIAFFLETRIEYVPMWLGLQKIGATASLINHNLTGDQLIHSLQSLPNTKMIIYGPEVESALAGIQNVVKDQELYFYGNDENDASKHIGTNLRKELSEVSSKSVKDPSTGNSDTALYIFTSGTTGMPKASVLTHARVISFAMAGHKYMKFRKNDVIYVTLPLYHTNGACMGAAQAVCAGVTVVLKKKFSASSFWKDCKKYECTAFIYIGELCRFLLASEPSEFDRAHKIRLMYGNGLRSTIWERFVNRFGIERVAEFYGSTEGIGPLTNTEGVVGSVGQLPLLWKNIMPVYLVKIDPDTDMPLRDPNGRCILVTQPGVPGMHVSKIVRGDSSQDFRGYQDKSSTSKKIINDVFEPGDRYYVSGDIFTFDEDFFVYFQDRTGDTFRWRGENVSTMEVEQIVTDIIGLQDAAVYGVLIPGTEGRAGMAAIVGVPTEAGLELLNSGLKKRLAKYARPIFLRYVSAIEMTQTFKIKKKQLITDGFNPRKIKDWLFYYNQKEDKYFRLTEDIYDDITAGKIPL